VRDDGRGATMAAAEAGGGASPDFGSWENAQRLEWSEDDNFRDDDLPYEPLEAPDDGPEHFEGEVLASVYYLDRPMRMLLLMGLPGAGKSTLAARLETRGWVTINQDTLGDRKACVAAANRALAGGRRVVIDRCNISRIQRRVWLNVADEHSSGVGCIWLDLDAAFCGERVLQRFGHSTLPAEKSSLRVIADFGERLENPMEAEGFALWRVRGDGEVEGTVLDFLQLAEQSEQECAQPREAEQRAEAWEAAAVAAARVNGNGQRGGFRYRAVPVPGNRRTQRIVRGMYLRAVRRQVEYYYSDANLRQDWFLQEKIVQEPEAGWLELRWVLSCPRIRDVHQANEQDVLDALGPSALIVKQADGRWWVRRGRPLPPLAEDRPAPGDEPAWYNALHGTASAEEQVPAEAPLPPAPRPSVGGEGDAENPRCKACSRCLPREVFSKAQLTKNRKSPTCKECVAAAPV